MLEIKHLSYVTPEGKTILDDINLKVDQRFVAITGPNGSGKSTLAKTIAGIITPTEGRILLDGEDTAAGSFQGNHRQRHHLHSRGTRAFAG